MKMYNKTLANTIAEQEGKIYYKNPFVVNGLLKIELGTITGPNVTVKIGTDTEFSTITTAEALAYINYAGGYSDTA